MDYNPFNDESDSAKSVINISNILATAFTIAYTINRNSLLYDTGTTDYIVNSKRWFTAGDYQPNKGQIKPLMTGGGLITPLGRGTAEFIVASSLKPLIFITLRL